MDAKWFAGRLRDLREAKGWTQADLAEKAGLTKDGVARLEQGTRSPVWETVVTLCQALEVSCDSFLTEPTARPVQGRGRPRKAEATEEPTITQEPAERPAAKPGRPRKAEEPATEEPKKRTRKKKGE